MSSEYQTEFVCSICRGNFDIEREGGVRGYIGILPVAFCPTCKAGIYDFVAQTYLPWECPRCGYMEDEDD